MDLHALYSILPIAFQHLACSIHGWSLQPAYFGHEFAHYLHLAKERLSWSKEAIDLYRNNRLMHFVQHCAQTVPYYRYLLSEYGVDIAKPHLIDDLQKIPIITKAMVQENYHDLLSQTIPASRRIISYTSGTVGAGLRFATNRAAIYEQWAIWWRYRQIHQIELGTWCGHFGARPIVPLSQVEPPFWRYNVPGCQILFSAYHMSSYTIKYYIEKIRRSNLLWLHGYPSLLALLAGYMLDQNVELDYIPRWITVGGENLLPQQVNLIECAFGIRPIQHYGMSEATANFSECKSGKLHVDEDFSVVEFIPNRYGPGYKVVGTNFTNLVTPLLRYDVDDVVDLDDEPCDCGMPGRIVKRVDGRQQDYIVLRNGDRVGCIDILFEDMVSIRESQIYQNMPGEIVVRIVRNNSYDDNDEKRLLLKFKKQVGDGLKVQVEYVDQIERSARGKLRFIICDIDEGRLVSERNNYHIVMTK